MALYLYLCCRMAPQLVTLYAAFALVMVIGKCKCQRIPQQQQQSSYPFGANGGGLRLPFMPKSKQELLIAFNKWRGCNTLPGRVHPVCTDKDLKKLRDTGRLVVADFFATWCGPCKKMTPIFKKLAKEQKDVLFCKIDVEACKELRNQYRIASFPTFKASCHTICENNLIFVLFTRWLNSFLL